MGFGSSERGPRSGRWDDAPDHDLIAGLRAGYLAAFDEFMRRFQHLVELQARRFRVPPSDRLHWVAELLHDVALTLARSRTPARVSLTAYVIGACARKARGAARAARVRAVHEQAGLRDLAVTGERAVTSVCSEGSLRDSYGPGWEPPLLSPPLERLVSALDEGITADERQLLSWRGQLVPYSQMAGWLGTTRGAVKARVRRLVQRLVDVSLRFGATLELEDRRELLRFLRRTESVDEEQLRGLETADAGDARARLAIMPRDDERRDRGSRRPTLSPNERDDQGDSDDAA